MFGRSVTRYRSARALTQSRSVRTRTGSRPASPAFLMPAAAEYCADRGYDVAIDALNVDPTPTENADPETEPEGLQAHHALFGNDA
jgi:kynurenine formamidase